MSEEHFKRLYGEAIEVISELHAELQRKDEKIEELKKELEALKTPKSPTKSRIKEIGRTPGQMNPIICGLEFPSNRIVFKIKWDEEEEKPLEYRMEAIINTFEEEIREFLHKLKKEKSKKINTIRKKNIKPLLALLD